MTTTTAPTATARLGMPGWRRMLYTETILYLRDVGNLFFVLAFPSVLLLGISYVFPGMRDPIEGGGPEWDGILIPAHILAPVMICVAIATAGLAALPNYLASYRETGVLRRLSTTPMRPHGLLLAQLVVNGAGVLVGALLAIVLGMVLLDVPLPDRPLLAISVALLATGAIFGIGLIIGGLANKATTASGVGMLIYFPMLFFAGLWTPGPTMPDSFARIATYTPLGAAGQAMHDAWFDGPLPTTQLLVMAGYAVVSFVIAAKTFRWN